ncbi:LLM class flavin-dependent oxidoreductase [Actinomadura viridis]|uniref:LLM class flavin-dependent oxidoreductase n=1 Tax=Actinomadura viridis TaxID=58110 RepID=UPI0036CE9806
MSVQDIVFGFGAHTGIDDVPELLRLAQQADRDGLDVFSLSDHPYFGGRLDAYAAIGFILGRTERVSGLANVTNLPTRPAPMLARTVTSLSALSGGRVVLGMGAGGYRSSRPVIDEAAAAAGRDPREIRTIFNFPGLIADRPLAATRDGDGRWIGGSAAQWTEELTGAVLEHGASGFILFPPGDAEHDDLSLGRWAQEIVPAVREATAEARPAAIAR